MNTIFSFDVVDVITTNSQLPSSNSTMQGLIPLITPFLLFLYFVLSLLLSPRLLPSMLFWAVLLRGLMNFSLG